VHVSKRVYVRTYVCTCVYRLAISIFYPVDSVNLTSTMTATTKHVYCKHYLQRQENKYMGKAKNPYVRMRHAACGYGCDLRMRHASCVLSDSIRCGTQCV